MYVGTRLGTKARIGIDRNRWQLNCLFRLYRTGRKPCSTETQLRAVSDKNRGSFPYIYYLDQRTKRNFGISYLWRNLHAKQ